MPDPIGSSYDSPVSTGLPISSPSAVAPFRLALLRTWMVVGLAGPGCDFSASTKIIGDTAPIDTAADTAADTATDTDTDSDTDSDSDTDTDTSTLPSDIDDDADGYTENDGDCLDTDPSVHPGIEDGCDAIDSDCDGDIDEDAPDDAYEPNDTTPYTLGSLEDDPEQSISAALKNDADVDRYEFTIEDTTLDFFTVHVDLSNVPADANYRLTLNRLRTDGDESIGEVDQTYGAGTVSLEYADTSLNDEGGDYEVVIESIAGASCAHSYLLAVSQ